jgi:nascent polypeptide-associated complex subunit alpha
MIPGVNPRQMKMMMRKMGIQQQDIDASEVIIKCSDKEIVITEPQVAKVNMMGQETFQITGTAHERANTAAVSEEDIRTVMEQSNTDEETARAALQQHNGDLAATIMDLQAK